MKNLTTIKIPAKYENMITSVEHDSDGYWAFTKEGYIFPDMSCGTAHEDTQTELLKVIRTIAIDETFIAEAEETEVTEITEEVTAEETIQKFDSKQTSLNQIPCIGKKINWLQYQNKNVLDFGGGKYNLFTDYVKQFNVNMLVYDKYNRTAEENRIAKACEPSLITCCNVLNVIAENFIIESIIAEISEYKKPSIFCIYEGNKTGNGKVSKTTTYGISYQRNQKSIEYMELLQKYFKEVIRKGNIFYCK